MEGKTNLHDMLKRAEHIGETIEKDFTSFVSEFNKKYGSVPGLGEISASFRFEDIDSSEYQKNLILGYTENQVLCRALEGEESVKETYNWIYIKNGKYRSLIPHRKDVKHNKIIEELDELFYLESSLGYRREGFFKSVTPVNFATYGIILGGLGSLMIAPFLKEGLPVLDLVKAYTFLPLILGAGLGLTSLMFEFDSGYTSNLKRASYIDDKIEELFS